LPSGSVTEAFFACIALPENGARQEDNKKSNFARAIYLPKVTAHFCTFVLWPHGTKKLLQTKGKALRAKS